MYNTLMTETRKPFVNITLEVELNDIEFIALKKLSDALKLPMNQVMRMCMNDGCKTWTKSFQLEAESNAKDVPKQGTGGRAKRKNVSDKVVKDGTVSKTRRARRPHS